MDCIDPAEDTAVAEEAEKQKSVTSRQLTGAKEGNSQESSSESDRNEDEDSILWTNNKFSALRRPEINF